MYIFFICIRNLTQTQTERPKSATRKLKSATYRYANGNSIRIISENEGTNVLKDGKKREKIKRATCTNGEKCSILLFDILFD